MDSRPFRVITKRQAASIVLAILALGAVVYWIGQRWVDIYLARIDALRFSDPRAAAAAITIHLKILACIQMLPLTAFCGFMVWYCRRAISSESLPPAGAWIVEGQRIKTGAEAVRTSRYLLGLTAGLAVVGSAGVAYLYYLALSLQRDAAVF